MTLIKGKLIWLMYIDSSSTDVSTCSIKIFQTQRWQFVPPSKFQMWNPSMVALKTRSRSNLWHVIKVFVTMHLWYKYQVSILNLATIFSMHQEVYLNFTSCLRRYLKTSLKNGWLFTLPGHPLSNGRPTDIPDIRRTSIGHGWHHEEVYWTVDDHCANEANCDFTWLLSHNIDLHV